MSTAAGDVLSSLMVGQKNAAAPPPANELGKEEFLKLLITQLKNQDPLDPLKDKDFIAQLAQFSSLEQLQNMNDGLKSQMSSELLMAQSISNAMVTTLIGKEVTIATDQIELKEDGDVSFGYIADGAAKSAVVTIYDSNGSVVYTKDLGAISAGEGSFTWDGRGQSGRRLAPGAYRVEVQLADEDGPGATLQTFIRGPVTAVKYANGTASLEVNGQLFGISDVLEVTLGE